MTPSPERKTLQLFLWGAPLVVLGYVWDWFFPINKALWTSSYVLFTGGLAFSALALFYWVIDVRGHNKLARPLVVYGVNAITVFVMSGVLSRLLGSVITWQSSAGTVSLQSWIYQELLASWLSPINASLAYALLWVLGCRFPRILLLYTTDCQYQVSCRISC